MSERKSTRKLKMQKENEEPGVDEIKEIEEFENPNDFNPSTQIEKLSR